MHRRRVVEAPNQGTDPSAPRGHFTLGLNIENLTASRASRIAFTGNTPDNLIGNTGADTLNGVGGDDTLDGGAGHRPVAGRDRRRHYAAPPPTWSWRR